jgi:hypothetical protein
VAKNQNQTSNVVENGEFMDTQHLIDDSSDDGMHVSSNGISPDLRELIIQVVIDGVPIYSSAK